MNPNEKLSTLHSVDQEINVTSESRIEEKLPLVDDIQKLREILIQMNSKILKLRALESKDDLQEGDVMSSVSLLMDKQFANLIHKRIISLCLYSETIISRVLKKECSIRISKKVLENLHSIITLNEILIDLSNKRTKLFEEKLLLSIECKEALHKQDLFLKEERKKETQSLDLNDPTLLEIRQACLNKIKKINIMKKLITNMAAGASSVYFSRQEGDIKFLKLFEKHSSLVSFYDFLHNQQEE